MLALPMMARLLDAVPDECRLVLVGDPDQLTSIDAGAVLSDLVRAAESPTSPLHRAVARLAGQHRIGVSSPLGPLAEAIRRGHADHVLEILRSGDAHDRLTFVEVDDVPDRGRTWPPAPAVAAVRDAIGDTFAAARTAAKQGNGVIALDVMATARILCAHRTGPAGVATWNQRVESWLLGESQRRHDFSGRAVLATRNDQRTGIVNGEAGIMVRVRRPDGGLGALRVVFRRGDAVRDFAPAELDELDTGLRDDDPQEPGLRARHRGGGPSTICVPARDTRTAVHRGDQGITSPADRRVGRLAREGRRDANETRHRSARCAALTARFGTEIWRTPPVDRVRSGAWSAAEGDHDERCRTRWSPLRR